ncbi:MAG TPA: NfeD family protein [Mycobacteriales bacterium]|nr:NfeD family protein [Mycobacteriales bacterium]
MDAWAIWLIAAGCLAVAEILTLTLVLGLIAVGALIAGVLGAIGLPVAGQLVVFAGVDVALLATVLPIARRHRHMPPAMRSGTARLIGERATALTDVNAAGGQVRIGGETWSARPYNEGLVIAAGARVEVMAIDGATAVVHPTELPISGS